MPAVNFYKRITPRLGDFVTTHVTLHQISLARQAQDPQTVEMLLELLNEEPDPTQPPPRDGRYTFPKFLSEISRRSFYTQKADVQREQRVHMISAVEADEELEDRYRCHELIYDMWQSDHPFDRATLYEIVARVPLVYGPWKALKRIFKEAEESGDTQMMGALSARFDVAFSGGYHGVSNRTLAYLVRRGWRFLRRTAETLPAMYADTVIDFLVPYNDRDGLGSSWVYNRIFHHGNDPRKNRYYYQRTTAEKAMKGRAFPDLWKQSPLPLFSLLELSRRDEVLEYSVKALKTDFRNALREIDPKWVRQLVNNNRPPVHRFIVWILENVSAFEQAKFRELELHDTVLRLLDSESSEARTFASKYAKVHARDLPINRLIQLANHQDKVVRELAFDLIRAHDPRTEIGLDAWAQVLQTKHGHRLAVEMLRKHFTSKDLTPDWFRELLLSGRENAVEYARESLLEVHSHKSLGAEYFYQLFEQSTPSKHGSTIRFAMEQLERFNLEELEIGWLEQILVRFSNRKCWVSGWVNSGALSANRFDVEFLKSIAFHPTFEACPAVVDARQSRWSDSIEYGHGYVHSIFKWLSDIRLFTPDQIGFEWLMQLVQREEPHYHEFATELMIKSYLPADFAAEEDSSIDQPVNESTDEINIDFEGATFVFTGKLATMTRAEAQKKVTAANGKNSGTVGKSLGFLVIGDEGSPMYGMGRKGGKQVKAESLNEGGASIRIISETAFLQMLTGTQREFSEDSILDGCNHPLPICLSLPH